MLTEIWLLGNWHRIHLATLKRKAGSGREHEKMLQLMLIKLTWQHTHKGGTPIGEPGMRYYYLRLWLSLDKITLFALSLMTHLKIGLCGEHPRKYIKCIACCTFDEKDPLKWSMNCALLSLSLVLFLPDHFQTYLNNLSVVLPLDIYKLYRLLRLYCVTKWERIKWMRCPNDGNWKQYTNMQASKACQLEKLCKRAAEA